jgi:nucleoside-diphosphate-sugar epimerase
MKILVTGGSGFIGSNLIDYFLLKDNISILSLDIKPPVRHNHADFYQYCDILDIETLLRKVKEFNPDYIVHLAAKADLKGNNLDYYAANIKGVENLIHVIKSLRNLKKVIFTSTMLVCKVGHIPLDDCEFLPPNLYGESKVLGEKLVRNELMNSTIWTIVRPTSIWGPGFNKTYRSFFEFIATGKYFNFSGKMSVKTYGYIANVVYQIDMLMLSKESDFGVYYLGDYEEYSIKDWSSEIAKLLNKRILTIPSVIIYSAAIFGDLLGSFKISFPMSTFRFQNMTTDNVLPLENLKKIVPRLPVHRTLANKETISWMRKEGYLK